MTERLHLSLAEVGPLEEQYVLRALHSGWVAPLGPEVDAFEAELASRVGVGHAVALSSGTAGLHLGLLALGVGPGDVVLTSTLTFAATANAIMYTGAEPYFIDCDPVTGNLDPDLLAQALEQLTAAGEKIAAIVPVDLLGKAVDYTQILALAGQYQVPVLSDAAESLGAKHHGRAAGSFGQASVVSFNGNKIMTTSGGGMLLTDDADLAKQVRYLATQARQPVLHYEHTEVGYNYRLSNLLAALGRAQLERLDELIAGRRAVRGFYREQLADLVDAGKLTFLGGGEDSEDNCWLTAVILGEAMPSQVTAQQLIDVLAEENIEARPLWKPMHLQPVFAGARGVLNGTSQSLFERGVTLPSSPGLTVQQVHRVTDRIIQEIR